MEKMQVRNRKSASQLIIEQNSELIIGTNEKTKKPVFTCGDVIGYPSPAVVKAADTVTLDELQYAECKKPELPDVDAEGRSNWVPCLMMVGKSAITAKRSLGSNLLH